MKIALINGSPKKGKNNSGLLLQVLEPLLGKEHELHRINIAKPPLDTEECSLICGMDVLVFAFPLYVDGIPSHVLRVMVELEERLKTGRTRDIWVYAIVNNGFFEGEQNRIAIDILRNWCQRAGLRFGQGLGQGAGEMSDMLLKVPLGKGPFKNLGKAMNTLAANIQARQSGESLFVRPNFPRVAWRLAGTHFYWNTMAKRNGLTKKDIRRRMPLSTK